MSQTRIHPLQSRRRALVPSTIALALALSLASSLAQASIVLGAGADRSICPDPTFNACYIGVDGTRSATAVGATTVSFVGLGAVSSETPAVAFPVGGPATTPNGTLTVGNGASVTVPGNGSQGTNTSVLIGLGNGGTGNLVVSGGTVTTPLLYVGEQDARVSTGFMTISDGGVVTSTVDAVNGPVPGLTGVGIGRGAGSSGTVVVTGAGSSLSTAGASMSFGRAGAADVSVSSGGLLSTFGSLYASAATSTGSTGIVVDGAGSKLVAGGRLLLGIAADPATGNQLNQGFDPSSTAHGTATLNVRQGGVVQASQVVVGAGGTLKGDGTIVGDVAVYGGTVSPGNSPGTLHVNGNYLMSGGTYLVEVAGTGPGLTDRLDITGSASLTNATILFSFIDGFAPSAGFAFDFLDAAGGLTFANLTFATQGLQPGFTFGTSTVGNAFVFTARSNGLAVPEPGTMALLFAGLFGVGAAGRRGKPVRAVR